jgi:response regulator NasT
MAESNIATLRVLIADEHLDSLEFVSGVVTELGHEVVAREVDVASVGAVTARLQPDVALVALGASSHHALGLIKQIVHESACPVIALLDGEDPAYVREAARRGVFAYIVNTTPRELQGMMDVTLQRFAEYQNLQGAFGRRAVIEQAKGILMAHHGISADDAFLMLREHSQQTDQKLGALAAAVVESHTLLSPPSAGAA